MNRNEAEVLMVRLSQAWHKSGFGDEWMEVLMEMDAGRAGTAFIRLRDTEERPPSIAKFKGAYGAIRGETPHKDKCKVCDDTGLRAPDTHQWGSESPPCEFCEMGSIQMERIATASVMPRSDRTLSERECAVGLSGTAHALAILSEQAERRSRRRAS